VFSFQVAGGPFRSVDKSVEAKRRASSRTQHEEARQAMVSCREVSCDSVIVRTEQFVN
jgi:hypothetical protein